MKSPKVILLDRDGVLNRKAVTARYVRNWSEFQWMPDAVECIADLKHSGYQVLVITNQAGVGRRVMTQHDLDTIHAGMQSDLRRLANVEIDAFYLCTHSPEENCACRKPKPGLILQAQADFKFKLDQTFFIGDDAKDLAAARTAGCLGCLVTAEEPLQTIVKRILKLQIEKEHPIDVS